jgi:membrane glycosyltransferase
VISALIAPIMMLKQCRAVSEILLGRDAGWSAQKRDDTGMPLFETLRHYRWTTALGLVFGSVAWAVSSALLLWMLPVVAGLVLAIPVAALTGSVKIGDRLKAAGLLLTPEERAPPRLLLRANELAVSADVFEGPDIGRLLMNREFLDAHMEMLESPPPRRKGTIDVHLTTALAKIDEASDLHEALAFLHSKELFAVLGSRRGMEQLRKKLSPAYLTSTSRGVHHGQRARCENGGE